jgi:hypothetical protein
VLDLKPEGLPVRAGVRRPASVLIATHRVVPFENMPGLGAEFVQWATGVPTHSQGSRYSRALCMRQLASAKRGRWIEVADELSPAHGWPAGFVRAAGANCRSARWSVCCFVYKEWPEAHKLL